MFKKKIFITFTLLASLCTALVPCNSLSVNASTPNEENTIISTEAFVDAIQNEYGKYGIDVQVEHLSSAQQITQDLLDSYLNNINQQLETSPEVSDNGTIQIYVNANPRLRSTTTCTARTSVSNTHGQANLKVTASITHSGNTFQKCNSLKSSQSGGAINFENWKQTSYSKTSLISLLPGHVRYSVKGELTTSFSLAGIKFTSTTDESFSVEFVYN